MLLPTVLVLMSDPAQLPQEDMTACLASISKWEHCKGCSLLQCRHLTLACHPGLAAGARVVVCRANSTKRALS